MNYPTFKIRISDSLTGGEPIELFFDTYLEIEMLIQLLRKGTYRNKEIFFSKDVFIKTNENGNWSTMNDSEKKWHRYG